MHKKRRFNLIIAAAALVVALAAAVLVGCEKEKNTENQSNNGEATEEVVRKPIAVFDLDENQMSCLVDENNFSNAINNLKEI